MATDAAASGSSVALLQALTPEERGSYDELAQSVARTINCTSDASRGTRKSALAELIAFATSLSDNTTVTNNVKLALVQHLLKPVLRCYSDTSEACRTQAVRLLSLLLARFRPPPQAYLPYLVPVLVLRLAQKDIVEEAEELRAALLEQLEAVIESAGADLGLYVDEVVQILARTLLDPFPEVKRRACRCTALLARDVPQRFHMACKPLFQPLLITLGHQHAKVRSVCVKAIGHTVQNGPAECIEEFRTAFSQRTMDHNPTVRKSLYTVAGRWMIELRDRYSYWHKILPILLSGETDDVEEIRDLARESFWKAGRLYEKENEERLKDQLDFGKTAPDSLPLGCRELVKENFSKILPGLLKDVTDWSADTRRQSARLLHTLLRYAGGHMTMHIQKTIDGLRVAVLDDEPDVSKMLVSCTELVGAAVDPEAWSAAILPVLRDSATAARARCASLVLLGACVRGSATEALQPHAAKLAEALADPNVCGSEEASVLDELVVAVVDVIETLGNGAAVVEEPLFLALVTALSMQERLAPDVGAALDKLAIASGGLRADRAALFNAHAPAILTRLSEAASHGGWTTHSHGFRLFRVLALWAGSALGRALPQVIPIFVANTHPDKDIDLRMRFFTLLGKLLTQAQFTLNVDGTLPQYAKTLVADIICPNLVWLAGERARAHRTTVVSCLWALLHGALVPEADMDAVIGLVLPNPLFTCLEDESPHTRLISCKVVEELLRKYPASFTSGYERYDLLHALTPELMKRLDDNDNDVRLAACAALLAVAGCMGKGYDRELYKAHTQALYRGLLIHLDDPNEAIQNAVFGVLEASVGINPAELRTAVEAVRHKHRTPVYCDRLLAALDALSA